MAVSDQEVVRRLKDTIEFLKVESIGGVWNTPQLIEMLEIFSRKIPRFTGIVNPHPPNFTLHYPN